MTTNNGLLSRSRLWSAGVTLSALASVALAVLDITSNGFSVWWVKHVVVTAVLTGVLTGFVAGLLLNQRVRSRERSRWRPLRSRRRFRANISGALAVMPTMLDMYGQKL